VEVKDFESGDLEYEIYTYGEQVVVIPVKQVAAKHAKEFAKISEGLEERILGHVPEAEIENVGKNVNVFVPQKFMKRLIGRGGQTITGIEREFGVSINVMPLGGSGPEVHNMGKNICIDVGKHNAGQYLKLFADKEAMFSSIANRKGEVVVKRGTKNGRRLSQAISSGKEISCEPAF